MATTSDGNSVVLGMGDGSMTTLTIADPSKAGTREYLSQLPSRVNKTQTEIYRQNGNRYPYPEEYSIYTDYLKALHTVIPGSAENTRAYL